MDWLRSLFVDYVEIRGVGRLLMLVPLILSVSIVYKTIRCRKLSAIPLSSVQLCVTILITMMLIGGVLLATYRIMA